MPKATTSYRKTGRQLRSPQLPAWRRFFCLPRGILCGPPDSARRPCPPRTAVRRNSGWGGRTPTFSPISAPGPAYRIGVYANWSVKSRWGVEGEARFLRFNGFYGEAQR